MRTVIYNIHNSCHVLKNWFFLVCSAECSGLERKNIKIVEHARKYSWSNVLNQNILRNIPKTEILQNMTTDIELLCMLSIAVAMLYMTTVML